MASSITSIDQCDHVEFLKILQLSGQVIVAKRVVKDTYER